MEGCFAASSRARAAICADNELANLEQQWISENLSLDQENEMLRACDENEQPADCVRKAFRNSIAEVEQAKRSMVVEATTPGDPGKADALIEKITGEYRASFENSDVSGAKFRSTDSMTIERISKTSIHYSVELNFYNGHSCGSSGVAEYERNGSFVSHTQRPEGECYLEIIPTEKGISFADPTGICRIESCGVRGGFDGKGFTFAQKQSAHP